MLNSKFGVQKMNKRVKRKRNMVNELLPTNMEHFTLESIDNISIFYDNTEISLDDSIYYLGERLLKSNNPRLELNGSALKHLMFYITKGKHEMRLIASQRKQLIYYSDIRDKENNILGLINVFRSDIWSTAIDMYMDIYFNKEYLNKIDIQLKDNKHKRMVNIQGNYIQNKEYVSMMLGDENKGPQIIEQKENYHLTYCPKINTTAIHMQHPDGKIWAYSINDVIKEPSSILFKFKVIKEII
jgi:hypothetical protein